jgi:hypothetical protein
MPLRLRHNLYWCESGGRAVFLDVDADRYFCLPRSANDAFLALQGGAGETSGHEPLQTLVERGLLIESPSRGAIPKPPLIEEPIRDFPLDPARRPGLLESARALFHELGAAWLLRTRPFHRAISIVSERSSRRRHPPGDPERRLDAIVRAADTVAYVTRAHDRCLVRALAVHAACRRDGIRPKLVFGVIAHPFAAHCWVQLGGTVLVGGFEQARLYTPILVIE